MDLAKTAADVSKEDNGDWVSLGTIDPAFEGAMVFVRSIYSPQFKRVHARLRKRIDQQLARGAVADPMQSDTITKKALAEAAVLDWKGVEEAGREIPCTPEEVLRVMTDRKYRRFADVIATAATQLGDRDADFLETQAKNSERESITS